MAAVKLLLQVYVRPLTDSPYLKLGIYTAQKMKFSIKDFFSKCDQIRRNVLLLKVVTFCNVNTLRNTTVVELLLFHFFTLQCFSKIAKTAKMEIF